LLVALRWLRIRIIVRVKVKAFSLSLRLLLSSHRAEVTLADEVHQVNIIVCFYFFLRLVIGVELVEDLAIEVVLFIAIVVLVLSVNGALQLGSFELVSVHASADFFSDFLSAARVILLANHSQSID